MLTPSGAHPSLADIPTRLNDNPYHITSIRIRQPLIAGDQNRQWGMQGSLTGAHLQILCTYHILYTVHTTILHSLETTAVALALRQSSGIESSTAQSDLGVPKFILILALVLPISHLFAYLLVALTSNIVTSANVYLVFQIPSRGLPYASALQERVFAPTCLVSSKPRLAAALSGLLRDGCGSMP